MVKDYKELKKTLQYSTDSPIGHSNLTVFICGTR